MSKKYLRVAAVALAILFAIFSFVIILSFGEDEGYVSAFSFGGSKKESRRNILMLGRDKASGLFDVIMLVSFDSDGASVLQIPRDTYIEYTENNSGKINAAPKTLGEEGFCKLLSSSLGVPITGYISFNLEAFGKAVDLVGGVEMTLDRALEYSDPEQGLYISLPAGKQTLNGDKAQMLVRFRKGYIRGDLDRLDVQKRFMAAFFSKVKSTVNIFNAYGIADKLLPYVKTNISASSFVSIGLKALKVEADAVGFLTLPGEDARDGGLSYYVMSRSSTNEALRKYFGKSTESCDSNGLFLNEKSRDFTAIYNKKYEYSLMMAKDLQ